MKTFEEWSERVVKTSKKCYYFNYRKELRGNEKELTLWLRVLCEFGDGFLFLKPTLFIFKWKVKVPVLSAKRLNEAMYVTVLCKLLHCLCDKLRHSSWRNQAW